MRVLVTGGAGYIGSVICEELVRHGHEVIAFDNLSKGHRQAVQKPVHFVQGDLRNPDAIEGALLRFKVEAVVHMAADSLVAESVRNPEKYYLNNVVGSMNLLNAMIGTDVSRLVFSSTAAVYGDPDIQPVEEETPTRPMNAYGATKLAIEEALKWYTKAYPLAATSLRYFNAAGATEINGEHHDPETHIIPIVLASALGNRSVQVFGNDYLTPDGTCVRDYIHVTDLAQAHVLALQHASGFQIYNLGCGGGYSVLDVLQVAREVTRKRIPFVFAPRRAGDPATLIASSQKIMRDSGWVPQEQDLHSIIESAWKWMLKNPKGYQDWF